MYSHLILQLQWMARSLIANEQGGTLAQLGVDPRQPLQHRDTGGHCGTHSSCLPLPAEGHHLAALCEHAQQPGCTGCK